MDNINCLLIFNLNGECVASRQKVLSLPEILNLGMCLRIFIIAIICWFVTFILRKSYFSLQLRENKKVLTTFTIPY